MNSSSYFNAMRWQAFPETDSQEHPNRNSRAHPLSWTPQSCHALSGRTETFELITWLGGEDTILRQSVRTIDVPK